MIKDTNEQEQELKDKPENILVTHNLNIVSATN